MANKSESLYFNHIKDACKQIGIYLKGINRDKFESEKLIQDGVIRQLEIIGEASRQIAGKTRRDHTEIDWSEITGMRDKLIHDYTGVNLDVVWKTATIDVPILKNQITKILREM